MSVCKSSTKYLRPLSTKPLNNQKSATGNGGAWRYTMKKPTLKQQKTINKVREVMQDYPSGTVPIDDIPFNALNGQLAHLI